MNERRLAQLLHDADAGAVCSPDRDATAIATAARSIRQHRRQRTRVLTTTAAMSLLIVIGSLATMSRRNIESERSNRRIAMTELQNQAARLDTDASERLDVVHAVSRSQKSAAKATKAKSARRDFSIDLDQERERAAAIILQAADQLREAGRGDLANDRYHDLISLFPDTAAAAVTRDRIEQSRIRT